MVRCEPYDPNSSDIMFKDGKLGLYCIDDVLHITRYAMRACALPIPGAWTDQNSD
jgi:hypothetical protein